MTTDHDRMKAMADALEPCPFCGTTAKDEQYPTDPKIEEVHHVRCSKPPCRGYASYSYATKEEAILRWNQRAYRTQAEESKYREPVAPAAAWKALSDQFPGWVHVTSGSTNRDDLVWNKDKLAFEPVDSDNEYVDEYIMVIRRPITPDAR